MSKSRSVDDLTISIRTWNMLRLYDIRTVAQVKKMPVGVLVTKFGPKCIADLLTAIRKKK